MTRTPLLSIVIPWRDFPSPAVLASLIVREAVTAGLQVIVVDDASTWPLECDVRTIMESEGALYLRADTCRGPGGARNIGLLKATGKFVAFTDADDKPHFEVFARLAHLGDDSSADVVIGGYREVRPPETPRLHLPGRSFATALNDQPALWRYLFRRDFLGSHHIQFPAEHYGEDLVFLLRVLSKSPRVMTRTEICYDYVSSAAHAQLTRRSLTREDFASALAGIESVEPTTTNRDFELVRTAWLARVWLRRMRTSGGKQGLLEVMREFPRQRGMVRAAVTVALGQLHQRLIPGTDSPK